MRHTDDSKRRICEGIAKARSKAIAERGAYFTADVIASIRAKLAERMTPERRQRFSEDTRSARTKANATRKHAADEFANKHVTTIRRLQQDGLGLTAIAAHLNDLGHTSRRGGPWTDQTVRQVLKRNRNDLPNKDHDKVDSRPRFIGWRNP